jgi:phosphate acetyltransferase
MRDTHPRFPRTPPSYYKHGPGAGRPSMASWTSKLFDEIHVGDQATLVHVVDAADVELIAMVTGDRLAVDRIRRTAVRSTQAVGAAVLIANVIGSRLPGPGSVIVEESLRCAGRIEVSDVTTATLRVREKRPDGRLVVLDAACTNQRGEVIAEGVTTVECPSERASVEPLGEVDIAFHRYNAFARLFERCRGKPPVVTAVVHPCDRESLLGATEAAERGLIVPVLVGPEARIRAVAAEYGVDLSAIRVIATEHSREAAERAVAMARAGEVEALMKGALHTDELMSAVLSSASGLRTGRRVSHVFVMDVPTYPKPLLITDAAINIAPTLEDKVDICQNAIDLARILGVAMPKVAVLSAVEMVTPKIQSTIDAAALCKMAERGQITGGIVDGPLAFDNAISVVAARMKHIDSPVSGDADILLVPDLESGNMLAKQLSYLAAAESAGVVLGTRVPIALTSRADNARSREASTAIMALIAHARRPGAA